MVLSDLKRSQCVNSGEGKREEASWTADLLRIRQQPLRTEAEIIASWRDQARPLVSVCCIAFHHERFIEDAIRGFLLQCTDFPIEILIHDDASTDRTVEIIREYELQYPRLFKLVAQSENQFSKGRRWREFLGPLIRGKYIAICEGDDFWTDPRKLQRQVDFLEANPDFVISGHDAFIIDEEGNLISSSKLPVERKRDYTSDQLVRGEAWILTMSWVYRNVIAETPSEHQHVLNGDLFFTSLLGAYGGAKFHADILPACYRVHRGGIWSALDQSSRIEAHANTYFWLYRYYRRVEMNQIATHFKTLFLRRSLAQAPWTLLAREVWRRLKGLLRRTGMQCLKRRK